VTESKEGKTTKKKEMDIPPETPEILKSELDAVVRGLLQMPPTPHKTSSTCKKKKRGGSDNSPLGY
jgi:hypothetical protein